MICVRFSGLLVSPLSHDFWNVNSLLLLRPTIATNCPEKPAVVPQFGTLAGAKKSYCVPVGFVSEYIQLETVRIACWPGGAIQLPLPSAVKSYGAPSRSK